MAYPESYYVVNPHNTSEIWLVAGNTRRKIGTSENNFRNFLGIGATAIAADWFDPIPITSG